MAVQHSCHGVAYCKTSTIVSAVQPDASSYVAGSVDLSHLKKNSTQTLLLALSVQP